MTLKSDAKFEEKLICCFNNEYSKPTLKIFTLIDSFCAKYITFDPKWYRRVIFHDTEE